MSARGLSSPWGAEGLSESSLLTVPIEGQLCLPTEDKAWAQWVLSVFWMGQWVDG